LAGATSPASDRTSGFPIVTICEVWFLEPAFWDSQNLPRSARCYLWPTALNPLASAASTSFLTLTTGCPPRPRRLLRYPATCSPAAPLRGRASRFSKLREYLCEDGLFALALLHSGRQGIRKVADIGRRGLSLSLDLADSLPTQRARKTSRNFRERQLCSPSLLS